jgi:hypothetical protein
MNAIATAPAESKGLSREEVKKQTAFSVANDLLERGLQSRIEDLHIILIQICDSGLLESNTSLEKFARHLSEKGERLVDRAREKYPRCFYVAREVMERDAPDLTRQVDFFRQEQFWRSEGRASLLESEELICALFSFYEEVAHFLRLLDGESGDICGLKRLPTPRFTPNRYESILPA